MRLDDLFIRQTLSDVSIYGAIPTNLSFVVDSRLVRPGDFFIALKGEQLDGHNFILDAFSKGASGVMISQDNLEKVEKTFDAGGIKKRTIIVVENPRTALLKLASRWRELFTMPIVGVTGSAGKTISKEMIAKMLDVAGKKFIASRGNQNTVIGAALNILRLNDEHETAVFEMGVNKRGEMELLARMIKPTIAVITNVGHAHMEGLGSLQDIALEKRDIFRFFDEKNIGIVNGDQSLLSSVSYRHPVIKFGTKTTNQVQARKVRFVDDSARCVLKIYKEKFEVVFPKAHMSVISAALVACAVGHVLKLPLKKVIQAIQQPIFIPARFEKLPLKKGKGVLINDCYNANPESLKAALLAFQHIETSSNKIAVIGDMLELGVNSPFWHRQIGRFFRKIPSLKKVILVGNMVKWMEKTLPINVLVERVETWQEAEPVLTRMLGKKDNLILVKGSGAVGLLNLVKRYTE